MMRFKFRSVGAEDGHVGVYVTAYLPLGIEKLIHVRLTPDDARKLIDRAELALLELGQERRRLGA